MSTLAITALGSLVGSVINIFKKKTKDVDKTLEAQVELRKLELQDAPKSYLRLWMAFLGWALSITVVYMIIVKPILTLYFPNLPLPELPTEVVIQLLLGMLGIAL
jgi:hypothetical protein